MLKMHVLKKRVSKSFPKNIEHCMAEYSYYSSSLLLDHDRYHDRQRRRKKTKTKKVLKNNPPVVKKSSLISKNLGKKNLKKKNSVAKKKLMEAKRIKLQQQHEKDMVYKRKKIWHFICKKDIPKVRTYHIFTQLISMIVMSNTVYCFLVW